MDRNWWKTYAGEVSGDFELWTTTREAARIYKLNLIPAEEGGGLSRKAGTIRRGGNSGFQALSLALHFGAAKVVLLGYDMQLTGGKKHWHPDHENIGNPVAGKMKDWHRHFADLAGQVRVPILNATRQTALKCFPRVDLLESLAEPTADGAGTESSIHPRAAKARLHRHRRNDDEAWAA